MPIRSALSLILLVMLTCSSWAKLPAQAPPLPPPDPNIYHIVEVSTAQQLIDACWNLQSDQAIVIAPGVYDLAGTQFPNGVDGRLAVGRFGQAMIRNVQIRGATDNPADVVIHGAGMTESMVPHGFQIATAEDVTIANLSVGEVYFHAVDIQGAQGASDIHLYNVHAFDAGQQLIKGNGADANDVRIEYAQVYYNGNGAIEHPALGYCYTNGIDTTGGNRWIIRDSHIHNIRCQDGSLAGPAILLWKGATDSLVERNRISQSSRGISLGLSSSHNGGPDHVGGVVRNNLIHWDSNADYSVDVGIYTTSPQAKILHNTVLINGHYPNAIEARFASASDVLIEANITDASIRTRNDATATIQDNLDNAADPWFVDADAGDLRLAWPMAAQITQLQRHPDVSDDFSARPRRQITEPGAWQIEALFADRFEAY